MAALLVSGGARAQDPQFSQFYSAPFHLNPGFAGNTIQGRFVLNYRHQWSAMPGKFVSYGASFDYNVEDMNSGFAFAAQQDRAGSAGLRFTTLQAMYAYNLRLSRKVAVRPGLAIGYTMRDINQNELVFGDQIVYDNPTSGSQNLFSTEPVRYPDFGTGLVAYGRQWWAGAAAHHLNQPNQSLLDDEVRLPARFSLHTGYNLALKRNVRKQQIAGLTFVGHYKAQAKWDQLDLGTYYRYKVLTAGLHYRGLAIKRTGYRQPNHDAVVVLLGCELKDFAVGYSYDLTVSKLVTNSGGSHEVSMIWELASERKKRKRARSRYVIPCAKF